MPELEPTNSPTTAPTTASVTDTFRPEKIAGIACGRLTAQNTLKRLPCIARARSTMSGSTDLKPCTAGDHDGEEAEQERRDHLGNDAEAEPHHEQRRDRDLRHRLGEHQQRIDVALDRLRARDQHRNGNAEQRRQQETAERRVGGRPGLPQQFRPIAPAAPQRRRRATGSDRPGCGTGGSRGPRRPR